MFNLEESGFSQSIQISLETITCNQLEITVGMIGETVSFADIIQDGIENNQ